MISFAIRFFFHHRKRTFQSVFMLTLSLIIFVATTLLVRGYSNNISGMANTLQPSKELIIKEKDKSLSESTIDLSILAFMEDYAQKTPNIEVMLAQKYIPIKIEGENDTLKETHLRIVNLSLFENYENHRYSYELNPLEKDEIIIGNHLSSLLLVGFGSQVNITIPKYSLNTTKTIKNIIRSNQEYDVEILADTGSFSEEIFNFVSFIELKIKDIREIETIKNDITKEYSNIEVQEEKQIQQFILYATDDVVKTLTLLQLLFFILMLVSITYSIYTLVKESEKEIFTLRSIGARNLDIIKLFMYQALFIGVFSTVLALFGGYFFISAIVSIVTAVADLPYIALKLNKDLMITVSLFSVLLSIISGIYPSIISARIRIVQER